MDATDAPAGKATALVPAISDAAAEEAIRVDPLKAEQDAKVVLSRFWKKLRATLARVPFAEQLLAAFYAATDPATPFRAKATLMGALAYFIAPVDVLPDFIAFLGYTDDATVLFMAIRTVQGALKPEHYDQAKAWLAGNATARTTAEEVAKGPVVDHGEA